MHGTIFNFNDVVSWYYYIYVQNVENIYGLTTALNSLEETRYELKSTNEIKIQPLETTHYHNILRLLKDKSTKYYTFRSKDQRGFFVTSIMLQTKTILSMN